MANWNATTSVKAIDEHEAQLEEKRKQVFEGSKFDPYYQRYGLFSYPGPLNIGCDAAASKFLRRRNMDGTVTIREKNFLTKQMKRGATADVFFSTPPYQPDAYAPPRLLKDRLKPPEKNEFMATAGPHHPPGQFHEAPFPYEYQSVGPAYSPNHRSPTGGVETGPKNFLTSNLRRGNPNSTPGLTIGPQYPHVADPYDRKETLLREERARTKAKILGPGAFKTRSFSGNNFTGPPELYSEEGLDLKNRPLTIVAGMTHPAPWRPNNPAKTSIYDKAIGKFPEHMPCPMSELPPRPHEEMPWRYTYNGLTRPTPALDMMMSNKTYNR